MELCTVLQPTPSRPPPPSRRRGGNSPLAETAVLPTLILALALGSKPTRSSVRWRLRRQALVLIVAVAGFVGKQTRKPNRVGWRDHARDRRHYQRRDPEHHPTQDDHLGTRAWKANECSPNISTTTRYCSDPSRGLFIIFVRSRRIQ